MLGMASVLPESRRDWFHLAANGLWMGPAVIVAVLACRRFAGAFADGMTDAAICLVASGVSAFVLLAVALDQFIQDEAIEFDWRTGLKLSPAMMVGWLLLVSPSVATIAFLTVQAVAVATIGWGVSRLSPHVLTEMVREFSTHSTLKHPATEKPALKVTQESHPASEESGSDEFFHEMTRRHVFEDQTGWDVLQGVLTVDFEPNQRKVALHIPICPPMSQSPEAECAVIGGESANVDVSSVHPYGVRLEVRRPTASGDSRVQLEYTIAGELVSPAKHVA